MTVAETLLPEYDRETRHDPPLLDGGYRRTGSTGTPHAKSMSLGQLSSHLATMISWGTSTLDSFGVRRRGSLQLPRTSVRDAALLASFDKKRRGHARQSGVQDGRRDDGPLEPQARQPDDLLTMPKVMVMRSFVVNHMIHHRGQLSVYLRQLDVPIPSIYGPSADEPVF
jgi:uncharacterized damage-inducible protein DinB